MYSAIVQDHFHCPRNVGPLADATHRGVGGEPGGGPYVVLWWEVCAGRIRRAAYQAYGCPAAIASASVAVELLLGRTPEEAGRLTAEEINTALGRLPEGKEHCPALVAQAIAQALAPGETRRKE